MNKNGKTKLTLALCLLWIGVIISLGVHIAIRLTLGIDEGSAPYFWQYCAFLLTSALTILCKSKLIQSTKLSDYILCALPFCCYFLFELCAHSPWLYHETLSQTIVLCMLAFCTGIPLYRRISIISIVYVIIRFFIRVVLQFSVVEVSQYLPKNDDFPPGSELTLMLLLWLAIAYAVLLFFFSPNSPIKRYPGQQKHEKALKCNRKVLRNLLAFPEFYALLLLSDTIVSSYNGFRSSNYSPYDFSRSSLLWALVFLAAICCFTAIAAICVYSGWQQRTLHNTDVRKTN